MFPFIFAFILAIGIPFLPSSLHRALHLPSLRFNFLPASYAPERTFVSSSERPLLLEDSYSRGNSDSDQSSQYLIFSHVSTPNYSDHEADSDLLAYMSFTEKLELNYPQTSIWLTISAQLLYQLVEAMIVMTLSFLFAATFLSRPSLSTLIERSCTALFICWHYSPKAALSSFLQDVFLCVHMYWMDNSVTDQTPNTPTNSQHVQLGVLTDSIRSTSTISEGLDLIASKEANRWSENSSSVALITPPRSRETSVPVEPASISLGKPVYPLSASKQGTQVKPILIPTHQPSMNVCSHSLGSTTEHSQHERNSLGNPVENHLLRSATSSIVTVATNQNSNYTGANTSNSNADLSGTGEVAPSLNHRSSTSFLAISMRDLYTANKLGSTPVSLSAPLDEDSKTEAPDAIPGYSLDHDSMADINSATSKPASDESQAESLCPSSSERSYSGRRRYKSDGIQVRSTRCHLGDSAAPPDPAKVNGTCAFWKSAMHHDGGGVFEKQVLAPGFTSGASSLECTSRSKPDQAVATSSVSSADSLAGIVLTPEGEIMVPASQRADGSMRKEIKVRPGHFLREPLAEKYRPPATRVRTSTWDPRLGEHMATPPSSPYARNSLLPFTPKSVHQRFFGRQCNSPASISNNWRRSVVEALLAKRNAPFTPPAVEKLLAPDFSTPSQTEAVVSLTSARALPPVDSQSSLAQPVDQLPSRPSEPECAEKVTVPVPDESTEQAESSKPVHATAKASDKATPAASFNVGEASRLPLRDITTSLAPEAAMRLNPPSTPASLASTTTMTFTSLQVANVILQAPSRTPVMESRETHLPSPNRKRKSSGEPNTQCAVKSAMLSPGESPTPAPYRRPRTRRSAPHLGKSPGNRRQGMTQTPEGSAKRRRMRTASALGVENVAAAVVDRNGQIVLPAGTGWKGRSYTTSQLPVAQRLRQPTMASGATS